MGIFVMQCVEKDLTRHDWWCIVTTNGDEGADMTLGEKIKKSRNSARITREALAKAVGFSPALISKVEGDQIKSGPSPDLVIQIADALGDESILLHYLEENPVYRAIIPRIFPELNNIRKEPAIIFGKFAREAEEAKHAAEILQEIFSNADPHRVPNFEAIFKSNLEQIVDVQRVAEILFIKLIDAGIMTTEERRALHDRQQAKCEANGHHNPKGKAV
jgi:transcriptional regulator with XRE-family HTH domain